jgi:sulfonate transport system substrate-binding protein
MSEKIGLRVGGVPEHFNLPWRLAIEQSDFKNIGLDLHWSDMTGGTGQMIRGLETGSIDVAVLLTEGITKSILQGLDAKILKVYVTSSLHWGIHVPFDSTIRTEKDLENKTFAISREGSGSHLMSYVLADQQNWDASKLNFNVVGDIYGGLWSLKHNEAQAFLWEKYTTRPHVKQEKCRYIGEVVTPWPCFVIAARKEILDAHPTLLHTMCEVVNKKAKLVKDYPSTSEELSWRYSLEENEAKKWLSETEWNYSNQDDLKSFEKTVAYLLKMNLISEEESKDWEKKLF